MDHRPLRHVNNHHQPPIDSEHPSTGIMHCPLTAHPVCPPGDDHYHVQNASRAATPTSPAAPAPATRPDPHPSPSGPNGPHVLIVVQSPRGPHPTTLAIPTLSARSATHSHPRPPTTPYLPLLADSHVLPPIASHPPSTLAPTRPGRRDPPRLRPRTDQWQCVMGRSGMASQYAVLLRLDPLVGIYERVCGRVRA